VYIQLDDDFPGHPKAIRLRHLVGPEAEVYPIRLWCWAAKYARDGVITDPTQVEPAAGWTGRKGRLLAALSSAGFIEKTSGKVVIHGWMERTGADIQRYEAKKARQREIFRHGERKNSGILPEEFRNSATVSVSVSERNGTELNGTEPVPSGPTESGIAPSAPRHEPPREGASAATRPSRRPRKPKAPKTPAAPPGGWVACAGDLWAAKLGTPSYPRIGRALKPAVERFGAARVLTAWDNYLDREPSQFCSPEQFAEKKLREYLPDPPPSKPTTTTPSASSARAAPVSFVNLLAAHSPKANNGQG